MLMQSDTMLTNLLLSNIATCIRTAGQPDIAAKVDGLKIRLLQENYSVHVVFCGLFSAGKSSLINYLCQSSELATGAVPTTSVASEVVLPSCPEVILFDTPGIDSTDDAHRQETEDMLYAADIVVLVMDYQHVEADENLELASRIVANGQRLWLVINQIDKHLEWELPFATYRQRIEATFQSWNIDVQQMWYTSTRESEANQAAALLSALQDLRFEATEAHVSDVIARQLQDLVNQHVTAQYAVRQLEVDDAMWQKHGFTPFDDSEASALETQLTEQIEQLESAREEAKLALQMRNEARREELVRSVELSQIAPYETTERGRNYIESLTSTFHVGWWRPAKQIETARQARLLEFINDLQERTEKFLVWPLQNALRQFIQATGGLGEEQLNQITQVTVEVTADLCKSVVKEGALVSTQYPYQYVKDVVQTIKRQVFARLTAVLEEWIACEQTYYSQAQGGTADAEQLLDLQEGLQVIADWFALKRDRDAYKQGLLPDKGDIKHDVTT